MLVLTGPPGASKSTVAPSLARRAEHSVHLETDAFFRFLVSGYSTVVDGIVIPRWFLGPLRDVLTGKGLRVASARSGRPCKPALGGSTCAKARRSPIPR